jgi:hypothetical protein
LLENLPKTPVQTGVFLCEKQNRERFNEVTLTFKKVTFLIADEKISAVILKKIPSLVFRHRIFDSQLSPVFPLKSTGNETEIPETGFKERKLPMQRSNSKGVRISRFMELTS